MPTPPSIAAVAVVVPVRDEQDRLERCLNAIAGAVSRLPADLAAQVVIVLDGCRDGSALVAARWPFITIELAPAGVGRARAIGVRSALAALPDIPLDRIWVANTDADSEVPADWLTRQLALADAGWDLVLGTVVPNPADLPPELRCAPIASAATEGEPIYGANLGVRAACYQRAGGFPSVPQHEDVRLVAAVRAAGGRITACYDSPVLTAGRLQGRAPGGYAGYLRAEAERAASALAVATPAN